MTHNPNRPDLSDAKLLVVDIETFDPNLIELGPGSYRDDGKILGASITDGDFAEYYNLGHYDCQSQERTKNHAYLKEQLETSIPKLGARIQYDFSWLDSDGITLGGQLGDVQIAEALIDENKRAYGLDDLAKQYLGKGKFKTEIEAFCAENNLKGDPRMWLWKMPHKLVRKYAIEDVREPLEIFTKFQLPILQEEELEDLYNLECQLLRCLNDMRKTGTRIDEEKRDRNAFKLQNKMEQAQIDLESEYDCPGLNVKSPTQVAALLLAKGFDVPKTAKGNYSVTNEYLKSMEDDNELHRLIREIRRTKTVLNNFLLGSLTDNVSADGLIHCSFYATRNDKYGTRSGRLSSATPNLQQIPAIGTDEYFGTISREPFIPFDDCLWGKIDWSQIEYRFTGHYAIGPGSDQLREAYNNNPDQDYHQFIMDLTGLTRRFAKNLNFGVAFGMGAKHMAEFFGWTLDYCYDILNIYNTRAPYVKVTSRKVEAVATRRGYIKTFLNRRSRLIDKSKAYTMFCRLIQGSAADLMKKAMVDCYDAGLFDVLYPHLTVHDELDVSIPRTAAAYEAFKEMHHIMEHSVKLAVPIRADASIGTNWANAEEDENKIKDWRIARERIIDATAVA